MRFPQNLKKTLAFVLKLALAFGIIAVLMLKNPRAILDCFRSFDYRYLVPAMFFYVTHIFVCAWRWRELARILGVTLSPLEALSLTFQGVFFSLVIPGGAIGGDVVKMGAVTKRSPAGAKVEGAFTVLMDRIVGMIALFVLELAILIPAKPLLMKVSIPELPLDDRARETAVWILALLGVAGLAASCVIFFHRVIEKIPPFGMLLRKADSLSHGMVSRLTAATDVYSASGGKLALLTLAGIPFVHLMTVVPMFFLLSGLGVQYHPFDVIAAVTIGNIAGLIPLFPGGVGGRDFVAITLLVAGGMEVADAKTAQLLYTGIILLFSLAGSLFFVFDPGRALSGGPGGGKAK